MSVRRSASGAGVREAASRRARMKRSRSWRVNSARRPTHEARRTSRSTWDSMPYCARCRHVVLSELYNDIRLLQCGRRALCGALSVLCVMPSAM